MAGVCDLLFHGICHQLPERILALGGVSLPACARCTGMYLGVLAMGLALAARGRLGAGRPWAPWFIAVCVGVWGLMGLDVAITHLMDAAPLAMVRRLGTGLLLGLTLPALLTAAMNQLPRGRGFSDQAVIARPRELIMPLGLGALLVALTALPWWPVGTALSWLSVAGLVLLMSHLTLLFGRLTGLGEDWPFWIGPTVVVLLALVELVGLAHLRDFGESWIRSLPSHP